MIRIENGYEVFIDGWLVAVIHRDIPVTIQEKFINQITRDLDAEIDKATLETEQEIREKDNKIDELNRVLNEIGDMARKAADV